MIPLSNYTYRKDHIPKTTPYNRRPSLALAPATITIHNTGNPTSTAANERTWLTNPTNNRVASYHIVIDAKEAIECLPLSEVGWHAGDGSGVNSGNRTSIGIEICERDSSLAEYAQALTNAVHLVAKLLKERGWGVDRLRRHYDWSGKNCPRLMNIDGKWTGWKQFAERIEAKLKELKGENKEMTEAERKEVDALKQTVKVQTETIRLLEKQVAQIDAPKWFVSEFGAEFIKKKMSEAKMTLEGWRSVAIALRATK